MVSQRRLNPFLLAHIAAALAVAPALAEDGRKFIFPELSSGLQDLGYMFVCESLTAGQCIEFVPYDKYVGKTGVFVSVDKPFSHTSSMRIFELEVSGKRLYLASSSESNDPLDDATTQLRWYDEFLQDQSLVGKPVVENSPVVVASVASGLVAGVRIDGIKEPFNHDEWEAAKIILRAHRPEDHERILRLLGDAVIEYDDFEEMVRIKPAPYLFNGTSESPIIEIRLNWTKDNPRATATIKYTGDDWLFVDRYILLAGEHRFESPVEDFQRDNYTDVWEWRTIPFDEVQQKLVEAILQDSDAKIRFYGNQYYHDEKFGAANRRALTDMLELWKIIG